MASARRYYSEDDHDIGVTPSRFKKLGRVQQLSYMQCWFAAYFEDPSNETPRDDGEFLYIWGGPYDARDELGVEFGGLVSDARMEEAIELIEADGIFNWAPTSRHPARQDTFDGNTAVSEPPGETIDQVLRRLKSGLLVSFGSPEDLKQRTVVRRHLEALRSELACLPRSIPGRGHNNPPPDDDDILSVTAVEASIANIDIELGKSKPDAVAIASTASQISRVGNWLRARFEKVIEKGTEDTIRILWGGAYLALAEVMGLSNIIHNLINGVVHWAQTISNLF